MIGFIGPAAGQFVGKEAGNLFGKEVGKLVIKVTGNMIGFVFNWPAAGKCAIYRFDQI